MHGYLDSFPYIDVKTGRWPGRDYAWRIALLKQDPRAARKQLATLRRNLKAAKPLLARARPRTARQRQRVAAWRWAYDALSYFAEVGEQLLIEPGEHDVKLLRRFRGRAVKLAQRTETLLGRIFTDWTMLDEQQTRWAVHVDWLDAMIAAAR